MQVDQTEFHAALLNSSVARPAGLTDGQGAPAGRRFDVYRNNVAVSLTEALEQAFPVLQKLVGEANFKILAGAFLRAHPPASPLMMFYGAEMPAFLTTFEPVRSIAYLPDVARLELALRESYHAADAPALPPEKLESIAPDALMATRVQIAPSVRLLRSAWPVHAIWSFNMIDGAAKPQMQAEDTLIVRPDFDPMPVLLPAGGGAFVDALMNGQTFGDAYSAALHDTPDTDLGAILGLLLAHGALTHLGDDT